MVRRKIARIIPTRGCWKFWRRNAGVALEQLESGEAQRPNFEVEKELPAIEIIPTNMHNRIEDGETCTNAPSGGHTDRESFVNWPSDANDAVPASPAPIHSKSADKKTRVTAVSVED